MNILEPCKHILDQLNVLLYIIRFGILNVKSTNNVHWTSFGDGYMQLVAGGQMFHSCEKLCQAPTEGNRLVNI